MPALGGLAAWSAGASEMPAPAACLLAAAALVHGGWLSWREWTRAPRQLVWPVDGTPELDGHVMHDVELAWRGPLAFLRWRDAAGRTHRLSWWPDTLPASERRLLKLAAAGARTARGAVTMAP